MCMKLESTNILRKFSGPFDILWSLVRSGEVIVFNPNILLTIRAMRCHFSQYVWYRRIFIILSRYSYINTFHMVSLSWIAKQTMEFEWNELDFILSNFESETLKICWNRRWWRFDRNSSFFVDFILICLPGDMQLNSLCWFDCSSVWSLNGL